VRAGRPAVVISETLDGSARWPGGLLRRDRCTDRSHSRDGAIGTCGITKSVITAGSGTRLYDAYTFTNCSNSVSCLSVNLSHPGFPGGSGLVQLFASAYLGSFNPASITSNYISDSGSSSAQRTSRSRRRPDRPTSSS